MGDLKINQCLLESIGWLMQGAAIIILNIVYFISFLHIRKIRALAQLTTLPPFYLASVAEQAAGMVCSETDHTFPRGHIVPSYPVLKSSGTQRQKRATKSRIQLLIHTSRSRHSRPFCPSLFTPTPPATQG